MNIPDHIFKAYDIRGLLAEVSTEIASQVGIAVVKKTGAKIVVVGRDMRKTSPELAQAVIDGITEAGADVRDIGMCTTSMYNFAVSSYGEVDAGVMITASHNPSEYNGIKMALRTGEPISGTEILEMIRAGLDTDSENKGSVSKFEILDDYLNKFIELSGVADLSGTKIVVDYGNGMASVSIRPLLKRLGAEVVELYAEPDADFPNHEANPAKEETLIDIKKKVIEVGADFGIATDGDGDRIAFIDETGNSIRGDQTLAILAESILRDKPGSKIIVSPNHGWAPMDMIKSVGGELINCRIGRTFIIKLMRETGAAASGEVSSHFFFEETNGLESIDYAFLLVANVWKKSGKKFSELADPLRTYFNSGEINQEIKDKEAVLKAIEDKYASVATVVDRIDGIRCEFNRDWWFIIRPSNTEPILRLTLEAKSQELLDEKTAELKSFLK